MLVAVTPAGLLVSQLASLEAAATRSYRRVNSLFFYGTAALCLLGYLVIIAGAFTPSFLAMMGRGMVGWLGLAMVSGRVLGWDRSWLLPLGAFVVLTFWGHQGAENYEWWEFTARPFDDPATGLLVAGLALCGIAAFHLSPQSWIGQRIHAALNRGAAVLIPETRRSRR